MKKPHFLVRAFFRMIPKGFKRLIVLSSLIAYIKDVKEPERQFIEDLDSTLHLSRGGSDALYLPIRVNRVLWDGREVYRRDLGILANPKESQEAKQAAMDSIHQRIPPHLAYANTDQMVKELLAFFKPEFSQTALA